VSEEEEERYFLLSCRVDDCEETERFYSTDAIGSSDWSEASAMGVIKDGYMIHPGYCPGHTIE
jgi:hypothetical protein